MVLLVRLKFSQSPPTTHITLAVFLTFCTVRAFEITCGMPKVRKARWPKTDKGDEKLYWKRYNLAKDAAWCEGVMR